MIETAKIQRQKQQISERYGEWTAHNIHLAGDIHTIGSDSMQRRLLRVVQSVADVVGRPLNELRVLDLGCLEGQYAIEFALHGAQAVGIEGRDANLQKARFVKDVLSLEHVEFMQDDVRNLSPEKYGTFDVVLCLGLLYHLDAPDVFRFVDQMFEVCRHCLVIDTSFSVSDRQSFTYGEHTYWGRAFAEHPQSATTQEKAGNLWGSLDNLASVWLTKPSLLNLLANAGFTSVFECHNPSEVGKFSDRITLLALKGNRQAVHSQPKINELPHHENWPERRPERIDGMQTHSYAMSKAVTGIVPRWIKAPLKRFLRSVGVMRPAKQPWEWDEPWKARSGQEKPARDGNVPHR